jgi:hypothetical protein
MAKINTVKLHQELTRAGIPIEGCAEDGRIDFLPEATQEQRGLAAQILAAHNPDGPLPEEKVLAEARARLEADLASEKRPVGETVRDLLICVLYPLT